MTFVLRQIIMKKTKKGVLAMSDINNAWIKERETSLCLWKVDQNRGYISNMASSLLVDFMCWSRRQIKKYVKMVKVCGFTGVQVTDYCSVWRACGSWERAHDQIKELASCLHNEGMKLTLWVWAAEFTDHGWIDTDMKYFSSDPNIAPYDDPSVRASFEKYYNIYADLAPYTDRIIAHFYDPGRLSDVYSIINFAKLLFDKFKSANPNVKLGIDTWGAPADFPDKLVSSGIGDVMLMELPFLPTWGVGDKREKYRSDVKALGCELGSWGWYTCEYEIDQMPFMSVNDRVLADVYKKVREQGDHIMIPSYWSEMDSYHILNFFSLYAAGHLLIDPDKSTDELMKEAAGLVAGDDAEKLLYIIDLIRDARSGDSWNSYWWQESGYVLYNGNFADILPRASKAIEILEGLIQAPDEDHGAHLPISNKSFYRLILPQLHQIRQYAEFSVGLDNICELEKSGVDREILQEKVNKLPFDIPEYNNVIGLWGLPEARIAQNRLDAFCVQRGLISPESKSMRYIQRRRLYDRLCVAQRGISQPLYLPYNYYECGAAFGEKRTQELIDELCLEGVLMRREDGYVALANWKSFVFDFNI